MRNRKSKKNNKSGLLKKVAILLVIVVVVCFSGIKILGSALDSGNKSMKVVNIPNGSGTSVIAQTLEKEEIIKGATSFKIYAKIMGYDGEFKAGAYELSPSMDLSIICKKLSSGDTVSKTFTVPEGYSIDKIGDKLQKEGVVSKAEFEKALLKGNFSYDFLPKNINDVKDYEGYLFADTYSLPLDIDANALVKVILDNTDKKLSKLKDDIKKSGRSIHEILTVASIIEKESNTEDMPKVASVIYNRLEKGMKLQMCSTLNYVSGRDAVKSNFSDINLQSPYNTYLNKGLPPGPIATVSMNSIKAALNPDKSKYLFFVVSEKMDGSNIFAETYEEHLKNTEKFNKTYYKMLKEGKIKE
ncbi:MAG: endolytic transglycosylase MltG [Eubacteriales bacterium]|nr:endolytic transglycosylase MltG [Eubacteriales bacterium]MDY3332807.1 endolytic transglycosylase MltG [Gallibacter sp.]